MTDLQKLRKALMEQLTEIENGNQNKDKAEQIIGLTSSVVKTYNVELRVNEIGYKYGGKDFKPESIDVFKEM